MKNTINKNFSKIEIILQKSWFDKAVISLLILLGVFWFSVTYRQYQTFAYRSGDTSVAEQAIWNTIHGRIFYQSILGTETNLREHLNFIQILYVPFYAIFPHTLTLFLVIQISFVLGLIFFYKFVKKRINSIAAVISVALFIFNPLTASQVVGDMHVVAVAGPIFLMLLMAYHEKKYRSFLLWTIIMVFISEFVAPTVALVGVLAFFERRNWKWFIPPIVGGVSLYIAAKYYITIGFGSNENIISKFKPEALKSIYKIEKRLSLVQESLRPLLWIFPWLSKYSILLIPSLLIALVIIIPGRIGVGNHVFILIPPILSMIFLDLLERFNKYRKVIYGIAVAGILLSLHPWYKWMEVDPSELTVEMNHAVAMVKDGGSLTASTQFGPKVNRREEFFLTFNDKMTDYAVLKVGTNKNEIESEQEDQKLKYDQKIVNSGLYRKVFQEGRIIVFVKKTKIAELFRVSVEEVDQMSQEDLQTKWKNLNPKI